MSDEKQSLMVEHNLHSTSAEPDPRSLARQASLETIISSIDHSVEENRRLNRHQNAMTPDLPSSRAIQGKYIVFTLAEGKYAVPINQVMEVGEPQRVTPVPNVPNWVLGITNLRGDIISVVDCGAFLNLHEKIALEVSSMCVVRNQRRDLATSLMVDRIEGMMNLSEDHIVFPEGIFESRMVPYLQGIYEFEGHFLTVLNLEGLLSAMELN